MPKTRCLHLGEVRLCWLGIVNVNGGACTLGRLYNGLGPRSHMYQFVNPLARASVLVHTMRMEEPRPWLCRPRRTSSCLYAVASTRDRSSASQVSLTTAPATHDVSPPRLAAVVSPICQNKQLDSSAACSGVRPKDRWDHPSQRRFGISGAGGLRPSTGSSARAVSASQNT